MCLWLPPHCLPCIALDTAAQCHHCATTSDDVNEELEVTHSELGRYDGVCALTVRHCDIHVPMTHCIVSSSPSEVMTLTAFVLSLKAWKKFPFPLLGSLVGLII